MIARAIAMRTDLVAGQAETEARTYYSADMHQRFLDAGFYHLYVPRRYGGYEFDVPTYMRVVQEIARGCVSTGWCLGLTMNHALMVASWWPQEAQDEIFAGHDFRASSVAAPVGTATRDGERLGDRRPGRLRLGHALLDVLHGPGAAARRRTARRGRRCCCSWRRAANGRCSTTGATCSG